MLLQDQVFIVHRRLTKKLLAGFLAGLLHPVVVDFPSFELSSFETLTALKHSCAELLALMDQSDRPIIICPTKCASPPALAGLLLSYPSIYYTEDPASKVVNAEVALCSVSTDIMPKILMQFSCPPSLVKTVLTELDDTMQQWEFRLGNLSPKARKLWDSYTGVESCTFKVQLETRRVPILSL